MSDSFFSPFWGLVCGIAIAGCELAQPQSLPQCADGQGLTTDAQGRFQCTDVAAPSLLVAPPAAGCPDGQGLDYDPDPYQLSCRDKTHGLADETDGDTLRKHIGVLAQKVASLGQAVAQLQAMAQATDPSYVGSTAAATTGRISFGGQSGLIAATALCGAEFGAGAHMCTVFQLTRSVALGKLGPSDRIAPAWVYMPTWHNPKSSTTEPLSGLADNCGGYSKGTDDVGWTGMAVEWGPLSSGSVAFRWHGGDEAPCSASLPIACCAGGRP